MIDTLMTNLNALLSTRIIGKITMYNLAIFAAGSSLPALVGMIMPRRATVKYGMLINKLFGLFLLQKRFFKVEASSPLQKWLITLRTTFQDIAFGIYIDSRVDMTPKQKQKKINEYFTSV